MRGVYCNPKKTMSLDKAILRKKEWLNRIEVQRHSILLVEPIDVLHVYQTIYTTTGVAN